MRSRACWDRKALAASVATAAALACSAWNPFAVSPADVYRAHFESPPLADVKDLRGGGMAWLGDDVWIRFVGPPFIRLRAHGLYVQSDPKACAELFASVLPGEKDVLEDVAHLKCLSFTGRRGSSPIRRVLVEHEARQLYYFRSF